MNKWKGKDNKINIKDFYIEDQLKFFYIKTKNGLYDKNEYEGDNDPTHANVAIFTNSFKKYFNLEFLEKINGMKTFFQDDSINGKTLPEMHCMIQNNYLGNMLNLKSEDNFFKSSHVIAMNNEMYNKLKNYFTNTNNNCLTKENGSENYLECTIPLPNVIYSFLVGNILCILTKNKELRGITPKITDRLYFRNEYMRKALQFLNNIYILPKKNQWIYYDMQKSESISDLSKKMNNEEVERLNISILLMNKLYEALEKNVNGIKELINVAIGFVDKEDVGVYNLNDQRNLIEQTIKNLQTMHNNQSITEKISIKLPSTFNSGPPLMIIHNDYLGAFLVDDCTICYFSDPFEEFVKITWDEPIKKMFLINRGIYILGKWSNTLYKYFNATKTKLCNLNVKQSDSLQELFIFRKSIYFVFSNTKTLYVLNPYRLLSETSIFNEVNLKIKKVHQLKKWGVFILTECGRLFQLFQNDVYELIFYSKHSDIFSDQIYMVQEINNTEA